MVSICFILYLLLSIAAMVYLLRRSLQKTLYSYTNIGLIAGILFQTVFLIINIHFFLSTPKDPTLVIPFVFRRIVIFPRVFSYHAVNVMIIVCTLLGISNIALIRHEGFRPHNALSILLAILYIGGTVFAYALSDHSLEYLNPVGLDRNPIVIVLHTIIPLFVLLMLCYFECILAGTAIMGWIAARTIPKYDKDYIIILGCSIDKKGGLLPLLRGRVNRAIRFAWDQEVATGKPLLYVPSGGQGPNEIMSEGSAMGLYLMAKGAEEEEVFPEKQSKNTWENFLFSKRLIDEMKPDSKVAFATTNYHILRSGILAVKAGLDAEGIAGDTKWYFWPNGFIREFFGILALEKKVHIRTAIILMLSCLIIGLIQYRLMF